MNTHVARIRQQLRQAFFGESWHGEHAFGVLEGLSTSVVGWAPAHGGHTIHEIVLHVTAWLDAVTDRVGGSRVGKLSESEDWPPAPEDADGGWAETLDDLRAACDRLDTLLGELEDGDLDRVIVGQRQQWSVYDDVHGVIQHSLYHLGQVVLLARFAEQKMQQAG